jgi:hypothetical protein
LSPIEWVKPEEVKPVEVSEREIQTAFEKNLPDLEEGLEHVHSFVQTPVGVIDSLAIDAEKKPVIVEFKKPDASDRDAFIQALDYYAWVINNLSWLNDYIRRLKPNALPENEGVNEEVRLILVAEEFDERVKRAVMGAEPEVMLIEYSLRRTSTGKIELLPNIILDTSVTASRRPSMPKTLEDHFKNKEEMRGLFDALIAKIREFEPNVEPVAMIHYINLRTGYCGVQVAKQHLRIHARGKTDHPHFREWSSTTSWGKRGEGGVVTVRNQKDLDEQLLQWIRGAFEMGRRL